MNFRSYYPLLIFFLCVTFKVNAQSPVYLTAVETPVKNKVVQAETMETLEEDLTKPEQQRQIMAYLKGLEAGDINYNEARIQHLYNLAKLFTKLRLYPLAMKCFFKTLSLDADGVGNKNIAVTSADDSLLARKLNSFRPKLNKEVKSKAISCDSIINTFNDGKMAVAYALIFHVKQPVKGKATIFKFTNTGHTFITLIKYNSDSTYASASFGFYPKKNNPLSATPIMPATSSTFKDDSAHAWDEVLGRFISKRRFLKILALTQQYKNIEYHLSKNNCTDFGLKVAAVSGLEIRDTKGSWPLGSGNNPAITGQSILGGQFDNADTGDTSDLLINLNN